MKRLKRQKNTISKDMHPADVVAALHKAGWSLRRLSKCNGYSSPGTLSAVLYRAWPKGERIIATALEIEPAQIWPSRYTEDALARRRASNIERVSEISDLDADEISSIPPPMDGWQS